MAGVQNEYPSIQVSRWKTGSKDGGTKVSMPHGTVEQVLKSSCIKRSCMSCCMSSITFAFLYHVHLLHCLRQWAVRYVEMYTPNHGNIDGKENRNVHQSSFVLFTFQLTVCTSSGNLSSGKTSLTLKCFRSLWHNSLHPRQSRDDSSSREAHRKPVFLNGTVSEW